MRSNVTKVFSLAVALSALGCSQEVLAPKQFKDFTARNGTFSCSAPAGWRVEAGDGTRTEYSQCKFTKGAAEIRVESEVAGSLHADMAKAANSRVGGVAEAPVAYVHKLKIKALEDEFTNYKERDAMPFTSKGLGEGRKARFSADGGLVGRIYGYHATLPSGDKRITVICQCPATNWKVLQPAFDHVIESMGR